LLARSALRYQSRLAAKDALVLGSAAGRYIASQKDGAQVNAVRGAGGAGATRPPDHQLPRFHGTILFYDVQARSGEKKIADLVTHDVL
jgi:hypothetical protein